MRFAIDGDGPLTIDKRSTWTARRDVALTLVAWIAIFWALSSVLGRVSHTILLFVFAALLAFALEPLTRRAERFAPRVIAVPMVYVIVVGLLGGLLYFVVSAAIDQISSIVPTVQALLNPGQGGKSSSVVRSLERSGLSQQRIADISQRVTNQAG